MLDVKFHYSKSDFFFKNTLLLNLKRLLHKRKSEGLSVEGHRICRKGFSLFLIQTFQVSKINEAKDMLNEFISNALLSHSSPLSFE